MKKPSHAPAYAIFYPPLCSIAIKHGYNLTLCGSLQVDMDLVAIPWTYEAVDAEVLVKAIEKYACEVMTTMIGMKTRVLGPEIKPHGRRAWSILMGNGAVIDLSIMPKGVDG